MYGLDFRRAALLVYEYLGTMRQAAQALRISAASICRWKRQLLPRVWPSRGSKMGDAMVAAVRIHLSSNPSTSARQLCILLRERFDIVVSRQLVRCVVHRLGFSYKRTRKRGPKPDPAAEALRVKFADDLREALATGQLLSVDESGFDPRSKPVYGYAPRGHPAILNVPSSTMPHRRTNLIMAVHMDGSFHQQLHDTTVKGAHFNAFVASLPYPAGTTLLMDNHSMHKSVELRNIAAAKGFDLLYTPPYSPEFNPIELAFGVVKNAFYKLRYSADFGHDMHASIHRCLSLLSAHGLQHTFHHVESLLPVPPRVPPDTC
jgi:transposase